MQTVRRWMVVLAVLGWAGTTQAARFGVFGVDPALAQVPIDATGGANTTTGLMDLGPDDLAGIDVLWLFEPSNAEHSSTIVSNVGPVAAFVAAGGVLSFHDRRVIGAADLLPGGGDIILLRNFDDPANIDVVSGGPVVDGPGGMIDDETLDGGNSSSHGYAMAASLPPSAVSVLSRGDADEIVDFYYGFGDGRVYYSTIPLDFYLEGSGDNGDAFRDIYAVNQAAFQAEPFESAIPEPSAALLVALGVAGLGALRWGPLLRAGSASVRGAPGRRR